ncbi:surface lipoprotein assembly modifier [Mannheimia indoligenes]|uniref:surface lipoprotein assembly modifier n=1 Tax=Mannheimia indoligenes TaxID=3103145 RepID=UPI002FE66077
MRFCISLLAFFSIQMVLANHSKLEEQLKQAIYQQEFKKIQILLKDYKQQENADPTVIAYAKAKSAFIQQDYQTAISIYRNIISQKPELNSMRMELAVALFADKQDNAAKLQFDKVRSVPDLPGVAYQKIEAYLEAINQRNEWQFDLNFSYLKTDNVANVSRQPQIENTGFIKNETMLPQKANGFVFNVDVAKDFNLFNSHYLSFRNEATGKIYWDNHRFDDVSNRLLLGYAYKKSDKTLRIQPFYDKRWFGNRSFHWSNGLQFSYDFAISNQWKNQTVLSFEKRSFFDENLQAGNIKAFSNTLLWLPNPKQLFYFGGTISKENTREKQYGSTSKNIRLGWLQEYQWGISSQLSFSFSHRKFHDEAILVGIIPLNKIRQDKIYSVNAKFWKRDWYLWGITPKLNIVWKKQQSNLASLYSYTDKQITVLFEKSF